MPVAFTMPATVRARKLRIFSFSFCKVLMARYLGKLLFYLMCFFETYYKYASIVCEIKQGEYEIKYKILHYYEKCDILRISTIVC